jgi:hypothetical protein
MPGSTDRVILVTQAENAAEKGKIVMTDPVSMYSTLQTRRPADINSHHQCYKYRSLSDSRVHQDYQTTSSNRRYKKR